MKLDKCRDLASIGIVLFIMGGVSVYVACIRNAGILVDSLNKSSPDVWITYLICGIITLIISCAMIFISLNEFKKRNRESFKGVKKYLFGIIGIVAGVTGGILCYAGTRINDDVERQLKAYLSNGAKEATGDLLFYSGIGLVIIAVLLILINIFQYFMINKNNN